MSRERDVNGFADVPQSDADAAKDRAQAAAWVETWRRSGPCPRCAWPFPNAPMHYCVACESCGADGPCKCGPRGWWNDALFS